MLRYLLPSVILVLTAGCASTFPKPASAFDAPTGIYPLPPKGLLAQAKRVVMAEPIALPIQEDKEGLFITGWKSYPGEIHIFRRWQERTRFRVSVTPDFNNPTGQAKLEVTNETETRAADGMTWKLDSEVVRPERSQWLLDQIAKALPTATTRPH